MQSGSVNEKRPQEGAVFSKANLHGDAQQDRPRGNDVHRGERQIRRGRWRHRLCDIHPPIRGRDGNRQPSFQRAVWPYVARIARPNRTALCRARHGWNGRFTASGVPRFRSAGFLGRAVGHDSFNARPGPHSEEWPIKRPRGHCAIPPEPITGEIENSMHRAPWCVNR